jgi:hypothetical protein
MISALSSSSTRTMNDGDSCRQRSVFHARIHPATGKSESVDIQAELSRRLIGCDFGLVICQKRPSAQIFSTPRTAPDSPRTQAQLAPLAFDRLLSPALFPSPHFDQRLNWLNDFTEDMARLVVPFRILADGPGLLRSQSMVLQRMLPSLTTSMSLWNEIGSCSFLQVPQ